MLDHVSEQAKVTLNYKKLKEWSETKKFASALLQSKK